MIVAVASGKGGTGKTLVATSLALSIKDETNVQLLDCDVEEPNDYIFLKPTIIEKQAVYIPVPEIDEEKCTHCGKCSEVCAFHAIMVLKNKVLTFPELCHGCGACSYLCPESAITEMGREVGRIDIGYSNGIGFVQGELNVGEAMAPPVIRKVKQHIKKEGTVIIDVSPGTSCPVVESLKGSDFCLLVTEPTPFGLNDLVLAIEVCKKLGIPSGLVLNRAGTGDNKIEEYCTNENIPLLLKIPLDTEIARGYSRGVPLVDGNPEYRKYFKQLFSGIESIVRKKGQLGKR